MIKEKVICISFSVKEVREIRDSRVCYCCCHAEQNSLVEMMNLLVTAWCTL